MKGQNRIRIIFAVCLALIVCAAVNSELTITAPADISVFAGESGSVPPLRAPEQTEESGSPAYPVAAQNLSVSDYREVRLCPGGIPFGIKMSTDGILVVGISEVEIEKGRINPGYNAGIRTGDLIVEINGERSGDTGRLQDAAANSKGKKITLTVRRGGETFQTAILPAFSTEDNAYKLGLWVKNRAAGIGTVTFYDPETGNFGGLGHGVCDADTGVLLPLASGEVYPVRIDGVIRGESGYPGELRGYFSSGKTGALLENTPFGVRGVYAEEPAGISDAIPIGLRSELEEGDAAVLCTVDGSVPREYSVTLSHIDRSNTDSKNFVIEVTDPELIAATGGIVQGMSGSPIIQNGKLVGALTHVLINDPTRGYGIFIENMIAAE